MKISRRALRKIILQEAAALNEAPRGQNRFLSLITDQTTHPVTDNNDPGAYRERLIAGLKNALQAVIGADSPQSMDEVIDAIARIEKANGVE